MSAPSENTRDFFIYRERNGTPAVVDTLSRVPEHGKESLRIVTLPKHDNEEPLLDSALLERVLAAPQHAVNEVVTQLREKTRSETHAEETANAIQPTSVLLGAAIGLGASVVGARLLRAPGWIIKIGLVLAATTLGGGLYYGWLRARLGIGQSETVIHPGTIVDDARRAADGMEQRNAAHEQTLDDIE